jgi:hypothetical protein
MLTTVLYTFFVHILPDPQCSLVLESTKFYFTLRTRESVYICGRISVYVSVNFMNYAFFGFCTCIRCGKSASFCLNPQ